MVTAAYYRYRQLFPSLASSALDGGAASVFIAVVDNLGSDGWLSSVNRADLAYDEPEG